MSRYRKLPVEIEAVRLEKPYSQVQEFCPDIVLVTNRNRVVFASVPTLEGNMRAELGDFIIKGVEGEFYPCKPDIFAKTYEEVAPE